MNKKFFTVLTALVCGVLLTACGSTDNTSDPSDKYQKQDGVYVNTQSKAAVMILGNHSCAMKAPNDVYTQLEKDLDDIVYGGYFAMINADSTPTKIEVEEQDFFVEDRKNLPALTREITHRKTQLIEEIMKAAETPADSPETDLLQALREAKSILTGIDAVNKEIIIVDTGISTTGDFNLCSINFDENPAERKSTAEIIDQHLLNFEGRNLLPDLSDIDIVFYGEHGNMAPASSPQIDNMVTSDEQYIKELWENIVTTCGAESVTFTEIPGWEIPILEDEETPHVSTVVFKRLIETEIPEDPDSLDGGTVKPPVINLSIFNSEIGFEADKATTLISPENFTNQYSQIALEIQTYLEQNPDKKIYIAGATAQYGSDNGYELSKQRAEVIKKLLTDGSFKDDNGNNIYISADSIVTLGLGDKFPDKVDEYPDGIFNSVEAANNRKVFIFNDESSDDESISYYAKLKAALEAGKLNDETKADLEKVFS